jgi:uncharacterized protein (TIGR00251 family)
MATWFHREGKVIVLALHVQPGAKRNEVVGLHGEALKIRLAAPPIEGRANNALLCYLAELFAVPQRNVELLRGSQSRHKMVKISGSTIMPGNLID